MSLRGTRFWVRTPRRAGGFGPKSSDSHPRLAAPLAFIGAVGMAITAADQTGGDLLIALAGALSMAALGVLAVREGWFARGAALPADVGS